MASTADLSDCQVRRWERDPDFFVVTAEMVFNARELDEIREAVSPQALTPPCYFRDAIMAGVRKDLKRLRK